MICLSSILNFPGKLWNLPGNFPRFPTDQFPLPPRYASQTEHEGHVLHGGILHGARWIYDKVLPHLREGPTGRAGGGREQWDPSFDAEMVILYHQKWGFHQENGD